MNEKKSVGELIGWLAIENGLPTFNQICQLLVRSF